MGRFRRGLWGHASRYVSIVLMTADDTGTIRSVPLAPDGLGVAGKIGDIQPQGLIDLQAAAILQAAALKQREQGRVPLVRPGFPFSDVIQEGQRIGYGLVSR